MLAHNFLKILANPYESPQLFCKTCKLATCPDISVWRVRCYQYTQSMCIWWKVAFVVSSLDTAIYILILLTAQGTHKETAQTFPITSELPVRKINFLKPGRYLKSTFQETFLILQTPRTLQFGSRINRQTSIFHKATIRHGAPLPSRIFNGRTIKSKPFVGRSVSGRATFSKPNKPDWANTLCVGKVELDPESTDAVSTPTPLIFFVSTIQRAAFSEIPGKRYGCRSAPKYRVLFPYFGDQPKLTRTMVPSSNGPFFRTHSSKCSGSNSKSAFSLTLSLTSTTTPAARAENLRFDHGFRRRNSEIRYFYRPRPIKFDNGMSPTFHPSLSKWYGASRWVPPCSGPTKLFLA